jgi:hypothetical protein
MSCYLVAALQRYAVVGDQNLAADVGFGTLIYGSYRVGTSVWGDVYEGFSCMKDHQNHILCIVV